MSTSRPSNRATTDPAATDRAARTSRVLGTVAMVMAGAAAGGALVFLLMAGDGGYVPAPRRTPASSSGDAAPDRPGTVADEDPEPSPFAMPAAIASTGTGALPAPSPVVTDTSRSHYVVTEPADAALNAAPPELAAAAEPDDAAEAEKPSGSAPDEQTALDEQVAKETAWLEGTGTLFLADGRRVEGVVTRDGDRYRVRRAHMTLLYDADEVERYAPDTCVAKEFHASRRLLAPGDAEGRLALSEWCMKNGLPKAARAMLREAARLKPDDDTLNRRAGFMRRNGEWVLFETVQREKGLEYYEGRWRPPAEVAQLRELRDTRILKTAVSRAADAILASAIATPPSDAWEVAEELARLGPEAVPILERGLDRPEFRTYCAMALSRFTGRTSLARLVDRLRFSGTERRPAILAALVHRSDRAEALTLLLDKVVNIRAADGRRRMVDGLAAIGDVRIIEALIPLVDTSPVPVPKDYWEKKRQEMDDPGKRLREGNFVMDSSREGVQRQKQLDREKAAEPYFPAYEALCRLLEEPVPRDPEAMAHLWKYRRQRFAFKKPPMEHWGAGPATPGYPDQIEQPVLVASAPTSKRAAGGKASAPATGAPADVSRQPLGTPNLVHRNPDDDTDDEDGIDARSLEDQVSSLLGRHNDAALTIPSPTQGPYPAGAKADPAVVTAKNDGAGWSADRLIQEAQRRKLFPGADPAPPLAASKREETPTKLPDTDPDAFPTIIAAPRDEARVARPPPGTQPTVSGNAATTIDGMDWLYTGTRSAPAASSAIGRTTPASALTPPPAPATNTVTLPAGNLPGQPPVGATPEVITADTLPSWLTGGKTERPPVEIRTADTAKSVDADALPDWLK